MSSPTPVASPHAASGATIPRTMLIVLGALLPATLFGLWQFGWSAILLFGVTCTAAVAAEAVALWIAGRPLRPYLLDGSALLSGWLLALSLPPWAPWWIGVVGALFAIVVGKQVFGGVGQNLFNPAMVGRVALLIAFPLEMTRFVAPQPLFSAASPGFLESLAITFGGAADHDAVSSATPLGHLRTELGRGLDLDAALGAGYEPAAAGLGTLAGSLGETSALLIGAGGIALLLARIISWHIPVAMLATIALLASVANGLDPQHFPDALFHLLGGATLLGAFFIATDLVTSPVTPLGKLLFGAGCGLLVWVIRSFAGYPEGVAFAVLLMNACTPLIDHYLRPRIYGRTRGGEPLDYREHEA